MLYNKYLASNTNFTFLTMVLGRWYLLNAFNVIRWGWVTSGAGGCRGEMLM